MFVPMKVSDYVSNTINRLPKGYVFTYLDFVSEVNTEGAVIKALSRMAAAGKIKKLSKGKYYKPEITPFGALLPDFYQVVKDLLEEDGKLIGYLTGFSIYNKLGLTTQVSNIIQVGRNTVRPTFQRERYTVSFIKQKNIITKDNIPLLQILDAIRYIKKIPDTSIEKALNRLLAILKETHPLDQSRMIKLALKYPPSTRAILGALLEQLGNKGIQPLFKSLNPVTEYQLKGADKVLTNAIKWNLK
jgi:hypothetical protein